MLLPLKEVYQRCHACAGVCRAGADGVSLIMLEHLKGHTPPVLVCRGIILGRWRKQLPVQGILVACVLLYLNQVSS